MTTVNRTRDNYTKLGVTGTEVNEKVYMDTSSVLKTSDDNYISDSNPLPINGTVSISDIYTQKMQNTSSGQPLYIGEAQPGTATSEAKWRIKKMEYGDGESMPPTGTIWADGETSFDKIWDNRATYSYS